jgi:hypothetical protein
MYHVLYRYQCCGSVNILSDPDPRIRNPRLLIRMAYLDIFVTFEKMV